jgi:hypothetical protein
MAVGRRQILLDLKSWFEWSVCPLAQHFKSSFGCLDHNGRIQLPVQPVPYLLLAEGEDKPVVYEDE